jgi:hypothetical protein
LPEHCGSRHNQDPLQIVCGKSPCVPAAQRELKSAIRRQLSAHSRQTLAQSSMPICSQLLAQASQTSAQTLQNWSLKAEALSMRLAEVWQISAQLIISRK